MSVAAGKEKQLPHHGSALRHADLTWHYTAVLLTRTSAVPYSPSQSRAGLC